MNFDDYKNTKPYVTSGDYKRYNVYYAGKALELGANRVKLAELLAAFPRAVKEEVYDEEGFRIARKEYGDEEIRLRTQFWNDFAEEQNVSTNHPKFSLLADIAWEEGHSGGFSEVYNFAERLVDFLR